jgi:hypothetical protein
LQSCYIFHANEYTNIIQFSQHNVYIFHKHTHANRLTKNCGDFSADGKYSASAAPIVENLGNQDGGRIIILHGGANDVDKFPVVFSRILHTG